MNSLLRDAGVRLLAIGLFCLPMVSCLILAPRSVRSDSAGVYRLKRETTSRDEAKRRTVYQADAIADDEDLVTQAGAQGPPTAIQRELESLYRKNGREMPSMNMEDLPVQGQAPPRIPGSRHGPESVTGSAPQATLRPARPNIFRRMWGFVRRTPRQAGSSQSQPPQQAQQTPPAGQSRVALPAQPRERRVQVQPQRRSYQNPPTPPALRSRTAPEQRPVTARPSTIARQPAPRQAPAALPKGGLDALPLLDESSLADDDEELDLPPNENEKSTVAAQPPQILPKQKPIGTTESPFSGRTLKTGEAEARIADAVPAAPGLPLESVEEEGSGDSKPAADKAPGGESGTSPPAELTPPPDATLARAAPNGDEDLGLKDEDTADDEPLSIPEGADQPQKALEPPPADEKVKQPSATASQPADPAAARQTQLAKLAANSASRGFQGFCPVLLKDERRLVEARSDLRVVFQGKTYHFSSNEALRTFEQSPKRYIAARGGSDVVRLASGGSTAIVEGSLEHAAWFRGRLYLFASPETRQAFVESPARYATEE